MGHASAYDYFVSISSLSHSKALRSQMMSLAQLSCHFRVFSCLSSFSRYNSSTVVGSLLHSQLCWWPQSCSFLAANFFGLFCYVRGLLNVFVCGQANGSHLLFEPRNGPARAQTPSSSVGWKRLKHCSHEVLRRSRSESE